LPAKSNLWLGFLVGVSGLLLGFAVSTLAYRYRILRVPGGSIIERMNRDLQLTPAQRDRIGDILRDSRYKVRQAQQEFQHHRHELFWQALGQVRETLTPEQQKIFDREFSQPWTMHGGGDHEHGPSDNSAAPMQPAPTK
jgi:Spy/CpxP family protein refolding chaperone